MNVKQKIWHFVLPLALLMGVLALLLPMNGVRASNGPVFTANTDLAAPNACPSAPAGLPDTIERTNFCVYYNDSDTTDAQATTAADHVEAYWDRYVTDFGFLTPLFSSKLEVRLQDYLLDPDECNGGTDPDWNYFYTYNGCYANDESIQKVLGHELFHRVQYSYDGSEAKWFKEGTARAMEDNAFDAIDNWADALTAISSSFNKQVNSYFANPNNDITSYDMRYNSAIWWKYFTEQYGSTATEPELGVDAFVALWEAAKTADDIAALNNALSALGANTNFNTAFRRFTVANWTKDLTGVPDASYNYVDEDQAGNPAPYGPLTPTNGGTINVGTSATWNNQGVTRYGARYYEATPGANCPVISASFHKDSGSDEFYHIVTQKGTVFDTHVEGSGTDWTQSFFNDGITKIVAIIGGQANAAQVDLTLSCADPVLDIKLPNNDAVAYAGPFDTPGKFLAQVSVTNGSPTGPVVAGLTTSDFKAQVNGVNALVTAGGFIQEQYWLVIEAPVQGANGTYDLQIDLEESGTATVIATDTNTKSVQYDSNNTDHALVVDRSGSMGSDNKMQAAKDAANFYIDITRNNDGVAVVPYNHNVDPSPFPMQSVDVVVRNNAKSFVNALSASGATSIGDGLNEAVAQRAGSPTGNSRCSFVLLSDGMENSELYWSSVQGAVVGTGCPVTSIAFGPASNETLMQDIATATGGLSFYNDVFVSSAARAASNLTFDDMMLELGGNYEYAQSRQEGRQRLLAEKGQVPVPAVEQGHKVMVDDTVSEVLFALDWNGQRNISLMTLRLRKPDGTIIDSRALPYTFEDKRSGHMGWRIPNPDVGQWEMLVSYEGGSELPVPYQVIASAHSNLTLELLSADRLATRAFTGDNIPIYAFLSSDHPISDAQIEAIVTAPDGTETKVRLFDDGQHDDGRAGDGFYANSYTRVNQALIERPIDEKGGQTREAQDEGAYQVRLRATHHDFQREAKGSFAVLEGQDSNNNGLPDGYEQLHGITNPDADPDLDDLDNLSEYLSGTDPNNSDTDGGGENDGSEVRHKQDPLDPADDQIEAPEFFHVTPQNGAVVLTYDVKSEYKRMLVYRSSSNEGPWTIRQAELPLTGVYNDTATNDKTYFYRLLAVDEKDHWSAVLSSEAVTPKTDPYPPEARVMIDDGAPTTADLQVSLSFVSYEETESFHDISEMLISNDPDFTNAQWKPFAQNTPWKLAATDPGSLAHVYVRFRDTAGNQSVGTEVGSILLASDSGNLQITNVTPNYGLNDGPSAIYIYGNNFSEPLSVRLGSEALEVDFVVLNENPQRIRATVPSGMTPGTYDITVKTESDSATLSNAYEVLDAGTTDDLLSAAEWMWTDPIPMRVGFANSSVGLLVQHLGGTATLDSVTVEFRLDSENGELLGSSLTNLLAPDAIESTVPVTWQPTEPSNPNDDPKDYTICAIIDPANEVAETNEDNNIICQTITVLPPHPEPTPDEPTPDTEPPEVDSFTIADNADTTNQQAVTLDVAATDYPNPGASGMRAIKHLEFEYFHGARRWAPVKIAGWVDYETAQTDYDWKLIPSYGMRYMQAWASDNAQNISLKPGTDVIDLLPEEQADKVGRNGVIFYRIFLKEGQRFAATMTPESGDPDMYVWWPDGTLKHNVSSTGPETVEFDAPFDGTYQIEIHGSSSGSASYRLEFGASRMAQMDDPTAHSRRAAGDLPTEPAVPLDEWPEFYDVGIPPAASVDQGSTIYLPITLQ